MRIDTNKFDSVTRSLMPKLVVYLMKQYTQCYQTFTSKFIKFLILRKAMHFIKTFFSLLGIKPVNVEHYLTPIYTEFLALFSSTFDSTKNAKFMAHLANCRSTKRQRYTYRVLQTIQMKLILLCVWAELKLL